MANPDGSRRKFFVRHPMQNMFVSQLFFAVTIPMIIIGVIVYIVVWNSAFIIFDQVNIAHTVRSTVLHNTNMILLLLVPVLLVGVVAWIVFVSGKLAGPLFRLTTDLNKMIKGGENVRIKLREDDLPELKYIVRQINKLLDVQEFQSTSNRLKIQKEEEVTPEGAN